MVLGRIVKKLHNKIWKPKVPDDELDIDYLRQTLPQLISESTIRDGTNRKLYVLENIFTGNGYHLTGPQVNDVLDEIYERMGKISDKRKYSQLKKLFKSIDREIKKTESLHPIEVVEKIGNEDSQTYLGRGESLSHKVMRAGKTDYHTKYDSREFNYSNPIGTKVGYKPVLVTTTLLTAFLALSCLGNSITVPGFKSEIKIAYKDTSKKDKRTPVERARDSVIEDIRQINYETAYELSQVPEVAGPTHAAVEGMKLFRDYLEKLNPPNNLFSPGNSTEQNRVSMEIRWTPFTKSDWDGTLSDIGNMGAYGYGISVTPIGFDNGQDQILHAQLKKNGEMTWFANTNEGETEGVKLDFDRNQKPPKYHSGELPKNELGLLINGQEININMDEFFSKGRIVYGKAHNLDGTVIISNVSQSALSPEVYGLKDAVSGGEGDDRYSAALQLIIWNYIDGKYDHTSRPFENWPGLVPYVLAGWGNMEGKRWKDFDQSIKRAGSNEYLLDRWQREKGGKFKNYLIDVRTWRLSRENNPRHLVENEETNCVGFGANTKHAFVINGMNAYNYEVPIRSGVFHLTTILEKEDGLWNIDNGWFRNKQTGVSGPHKSRADISKLYLN